MNFGPKFSQLLFTNNVYGISWNIYLKLNNYLKNKVPGVGRRLFKGALNWAAYKKIKIFLSSIFDFVPQY